MARTNIKHKNASISAVKKKLIIIRIENRMKSNGGYSLSLEYQKESHHIQKKRLKKRLIIAIQR
jgi:hypothetical protein